MGSISRILIQSVVGASLGSSLVDVGIVPGAIFGATAGLVQYTSNKISKPFFNENSLVIKVASYALSLIAAAITIYMTFNKLNMDMLSAKSFALLSVTSIGIGITSSITSEVGKTVFNCSLIAGGIWAAIKLVQIRALFN